MSIADRLRRGAVAALSSPRGDAVVTDQTPSFWSNRSTGLGTVTHDPNTHMEPGVVVPLALDTLANIYLADPIGGVAVSAVVDDALKGGFSAKYNGEVESDTKRKASVNKCLKSIDAEEKTRKAAKWGRCMGLGGMLLQVNGGQMSAEVPLVDDAIRSIERLVVFDARDVTVQGWDVDDHMTYAWNPANAETLAIMPSTTNLHASHTITFGGLDTPLRDKLRYFRGFDNNVLQMVWQTIREFRTSWQSASGMMSNASQTVMKIPGLWEVLGSARQMLIDRMADVAMTRSLHRILLLDAGRGNDPSEEYEEVARSFSGISDLLTEQKTLVAQAAQMPVTRLFGISPAGLNATGKSDQENWLSVVAAWRRAMIDPALDRLIQIVASTVGAVDPEMWGVDWPELEVLGMQAKAELESSHVATDTARVALGVPDGVVLRSRYAQGEYSNHPPTMTEEDLEGVEAKAPPKDDPEPEPTPQKADPSAV